MNRPVSIIMILIIVLVLTVSINSIGYSSLGGGYVLAQQPSNVSSNSSSVNNALYDYLTYENSTLGVRMLYPSNWTIEHLGSNVSFGSGPFGFGSLILSVSKLPENRSLNDLMNENLRSFGDYFEREGPMGKLGYIVELKPTLISDGKQAFRFHYVDTCMPDMMQCTNLEVWTIHDNKVYKFHHKTFGDIDPRVEKMIGSFSPV